MQKYVSFLSQALATLVLLAGAVLLVGAVLVPRLTGATTYAVLASSMAPRYPMGTLMVVRPAQTIYTGDVITFQPNSADPNVVTHRVVAIGATVGGELRYTTQGDANTAADPALVSQEQVRGVLWYAIPFAGFLVVAVNNVQQNATLVAAGLLGIYAVWQVVRFRQEQQVATAHDAPVAVPDAVPELQPATVVATVNVAAPVPAGTNPFQPAMTRAERKRLGGFTSADQPEFSLIS